MEAGAAAETEPLLPPRSWRAARGGECVAEGGVLPRLSADCFRRPGGFLERRCRASGLGRPLRLSVRRSAAVQLPLAAVGSEPRSESFFLSNFAAAGAAEDLHINQAVVFIEDAIQVSPTRRRAALRPFAGCVTRVLSAGAARPAVTSEPRIPAAHRFQGASAQKKCGSFSNEIVLK